MFHNPGVLFEASEQAGSVADGGVDGEVQSFQKIPLALCVSLCFCISTHPNSSAAVTPVSDATKTMLYPVGRSA